MNFPPILILAIVWLLIGLPLSKLNNKAKQQQASGTRKPGAGSGKNAKAPRAEVKKPAPAQTAPEAPARPTVMQPTISVTEHDDSVYMGSLYAVTGEGYDPCHDEQLAPLTQAEAAVPAAEAAEPGLQLSWTGSDIVRGFVMSEILKKK